MSRVLHVVIAVAVVLVASSPSWACAVCGASKAENDWAFGLMTIVLSLLPLLMFAGVVFFVVRTVRKHGDHDDDGPPISPAE